jgi:hypothetical protein
MKKVKSTLFLVTISILPFTCLNGQNSAESASNKNSSNSSVIRYTNITEISYGLGFGSDIDGSQGHSTFGIHTINGCLFYSKLGLGFGIGLDRLRIDKNLGQTILPVSIDIRYYFLKDPKILFCGIEGGYTYNLSGVKLDYESGLVGFFINPSIGARVFHQEKASLIINLGFKIQENTIQYVWTPLPKNEMLLNIKAGILF